MNDTDLKLLYDVMTDHYGFGFIAMKTRRRNVSEKKQMFAVIARFYGASYTKIANFIGWTTHSTAISACSRILGYMDIYPVFKQEFDIICKKYESCRNSAM